MSARLKAADQNALSIGWYAENFARSKRMKPLSEYLKPEPTAEEKREMGAMQLVAMLEAMERRGARNGAE